MIHWLQTHQVIVGIAVYYLFSNSVQALPAPDEKSSALYRWGFSASHGLAGNIRYALQKLFPQYIEPKN